MNPGAGAARPVTEVAVGVLMRADGAVLLADRPAGKPYAGYWEFPGGKVEAGETVAQALARELAEELGITVHASTPWVVIEYDYPHAYVRLHFRRVHDWTGTPQPVEGQQLRFLAPGAMPPAPLLPAAIPAMRWIELPSVIARSPQTAASADDAVQWLHGLLDRGLRQVHWREPGLAGAERADALARCAALAALHEARLLLEPDDCAVLAGSGAAALPPAIGCYLPVVQLRVAAARPAISWMAAGVQTPDDMQRAAALGCDCMVMEAAEAAGAPEGGRASQLFAAPPLPLYVPGAWRLDSLRAAQALGAHGLVIAPSAVGD